MKDVCNHCIYQVSDDKGGVKCRVAYYRVDVYGSFYEGSRCVHDDRLRDKFSSETNESDTADLSFRISALHQVIIDQRHEISVLKDRLTHID